MKDHKMITKLAIKKDTHLKEFLKSGGREGSGVDFEKLLKLASKPLPRRPSKPGKE